MIFNPTPVLLQISSKPGDRPGTLKSPVGLRHSALGALPSPMAARIRRRRKIGPIVLRRPRLQPPDQLLWDL